ncbi:hypothetical protein [Streptosporangium sp. LJ11]
MTIAYEWRGHFGNRAINTLHAQGFGHARLRDDWRAPRKLGPRQSK